MKFSIVVPNLNYGRFIDDCLASLAAQRNVDLSVVIVDGGSVDGSLDIIRRYCTKFGWHYYIEESLGLVESLKVGFERVDGDANAVFGWLNSDDFLLRNDALAIIAEYFHAHTRVDVVSLGGYFVDSSGVLSKPICYDYHPLIRRNVLKRGGAFLQPATFWTREVFQSVPLRSEYNYTFDGVFFLESIAGGFNFFHNPSVYIAGYRLHGENLSLNVPSLRVAELGQLYSNALGRPVAGLYLSLMASLFKILDRVPFIGIYFKRILRLLNNALSFLTVYRVPSI